MNEKFSRGQAVSVPPFGYRMGNSRFEPDEDTAPFVPLIYRKYSQGCSLRRIAAWLNSAGIRTARGNLFESRTVEYILSNPVYTGKLRRRISSDKAGAPKSPVSGTADRFYRGQDVQIVPASHIPLVPEELFDAVQKRLTRNRECVLPCSENASDTAQKAGILSGGILRWQCLRFRPCVRRPGTCASMRRLRKRPLPQQPLYFPAVSEASCPAGAGRMSSVPARGVLLRAAPRSLPCRRRTAGIPVLSGPGSAPKKNGWNGCGWHMRQGRIPWKNTSSESRRSGKKSLS